MRVPRATVPESTDNESTAPQRRGRFIDGATFGAFLQNRRESRNVSLHDIAAQTKIGTRHLTALERGDVRSWPGGLYSRAMVRAYAAAIGLDPEATVCEFADVFDEVPAPVEPDPSPKPSALPGLLGQARASVGLALAICAVVAALAWAATSSDAAGTTGANRVLAGSTVGHHPDATPPETRSGVVAPSNAADFEALQQVANVMPPSALPVEPPAGVEGSMRITSEPAGADVTVNGIRWGQTPVTVRHVPPGEKRVRLSKDGYKSVERRLQLTADNPTQAVREVLPVEP